MKIIWLGQAGLLFELNHKILMIDPYLSDSVEKITPGNRRNVPVDQKFLNIKPDIIALTHNHLDHTDPETLKYYLTDHSKVCVLASTNAWETVKKFAGQNNYIEFNRHTEWSEQGIKFTAVKAEHSDKYAIGIIIEAENKTFYITGDTLYNSDIFHDLPEKIDYIFLPVNGNGNNMNFADAKRFCKKIGAIAIPLHCGLFDHIDFTRFDYEPKIIPQFYQQINI